MQVERVYLASVEPKTGVERVRGAFTYRFPSPRPVPQCRHLSHCERGLVVPPAVVRAADKQKPTTAQWNLIIFRQQRSGERVSAGLVETVSSGRVRAKGIADCAPQSVDASFRDLPQVRLHLRPRLLDRVIVRRVGRKKSTWAPRANLPSTIMAPGILAATPVRQGRKEYCEIFI